MRKLAAKASQLLEYTRTHDCGRLKDAVLSQPASEVKPFAPMPDSPLGRRSVRLARPASIKDVCAPIHQTDFRMSFEQVNSSSQRARGQHVIGIEYRDIGFARPIQSFIVSVDMTLV